MSCPDRSRSPKWRADGPRGRRGKYIIQLVWPTLESIIYVLETEKGRERERERRSKKRLAFVNSAE